MSKLRDLFLAAILSIGLFTELRITAFPKFENDNQYAWFIFIAASRPDWSGYVPENWRSRTLSMELSAGWCDVLGVPPIKVSADRSANKDARAIFWVAHLQDRDCMALASYNALFFFLVCVVLLLSLESPLVPMLGTFASILTSAPGSLSPYVLPWDLPTMFAWTAIFALYSKLKGKPELIWLALPIAILGLLKETVLVTSLFFVAAPWPWQKRIGVIVGTVAASQLLNWGLFGANPDWLFSVSSAASTAGSRWNLLMLWPIVLANSGSVVLLPWLLWKKRDWSLASVCISFIVLQALNNLACGVYNENRDWLELAPIAWLLISEQSARKMA